MRFYRVVKSGTNNPANAPQISILSPANGTNITGETIVRISASSSLDMDAIRLFVDGAEVGFSSDADTNFVLNSCQFPNGLHTIFAVAGNSSGAESTDDVNANDVQQNFGVSQSVPVTFNNLITDYSGRLRFNDPAQGETNRFLARFALYADWTLRITNNSGVAVRTVVGTGYNMAFLWNGTGDGGTALPAGGYGVVLSAVQSSSSPPAPMPPPTNSPPAPGLAQDMYGSMSEAMAAGATSYFILHPPMPPVRTNGVWMPWEEVFGPLPLIEIPVPSELSANSVQSATPSGFGPLDGPQPDPPTSQTTVLEPLPSVWFGSLGTMGIAYQGNHPGNLWPANTAPDDGLFGTIRLNTRSPAGAYGKLNTVNLIALGFNRFLADAGYRLKFYKGNFDLHAYDLRGPDYGGNGIFDSVNIGFLVGHGVYGLEPDFNISFDGPLQSYYPVYTGSVGYDWVRLSEFEFGNANIGSNLRWMSILNCNNLVDSVYQDCYDKEALPVGDNLHLLCGAKTVIFMVYNFGLRYSAALTGHAADRRSIENSWFYAGTQTQGRQPGGPHLPVIFRVIGWPNCFSDDLLNYQTPNSGNPGDIQNEDQTVFNYP